MQSTSSLAFLSLSCRRWKFWDEGFVQNRKKKWQHVPKSHTIDTMQHGNCIALSRTIVRAVCRICNARRSFVNGVLGMPNSGTNNVWSLCSLW